MEYNTLVDTIAQKRQHTFVQYQKHRLVTSREYVSLQLQKHGGPLSRAFQASPHRGIGHRSTKNSPPSSFEFNLGQLKDLDAASGPCAPIITSSTPTPVQS